MTKSTKIRTPEQEAAKTARAIGLSPEQTRQGTVKVDAITLPGEKVDHHHLHTVRKLTRIEKLHKRGVLTKDEAAACEWYHSKHSLGYETVGVTAKYGEQTGGGGTVCHMAKYRAQQEARDDYSFARVAIPPQVLTLFEAVVIHGRAVVETGGRLAARRFRWAASKLHERICHMLPIG